MPEENFKLLIRDSCTRTILGVLFFEPGRIPRNLRKPIFEFFKVLDLFLNNNTITELTSDFFHDGNRELWRKTRTVTMNFCGIKTVAENAFEHLTKLSGRWMIT